MTRRRIRIEAQGAVSVVRGWRAQDLIREAGIKPFFAGGGWLVDADRVPDLLAHLQRRGIAVEVIGSGSPRPARVADATPQTPAPESEGEADEVDLPLWDDPPGGAA